MNKSQFENLDALVAPIAKGDLDGYGVLSTGERLYIALAANRTDLLESEGFTIAEALARLGADAAKFVERWENLGNPKNF